MSTPTTRHGLPIDPVTKKFVKRTAAAAAASPPQPAPDKDKPRQAEPEKPTAVLVDKANGTRDPWWDPLI